MDFKSEDLELDFLALNLKNRKNKISEIDEIFHDSSKFNCISYNHKNNESKPYQNFVNFKFIFSPIENHH